ncbi:MAG: nonribosomal peptide synthetase MxaA [Pseudomonadota bacterium]
MKNIIQGMAKILTLISFGLYTSVAMALASEAKLISVVNPSQSNGIQVGDVLHRTVRIEVDSSYQLPKNALPMKGERQNGVELSGIEVKLSEHHKKSLYTIALHYQVFASAAKPEVMYLPAEHFSFTGGAQPLDIKVPTWGFWFSPLVADGISNAKENLQPQYKPTLFDISTHTNRLWVLLGLLFVGLAGLLYVNADIRWLPWMNGAFAEAHRKLKKLSKTPEGQKQALVYMHQAFNKIHGENLFGHEAEPFLVANPHFSALTADIKAFFERSNASLFASQPSNSSQFIHELIVLSKRLRDCERGVA